MPDPRPALAPVTVAFEICLFVLILGVRAARVRELARPLRPGTRLRYEGNRWEHAIVSAWVAAWLVALLILLVERVIGPVVGLPSFMVVTAAVALVGYGAHVLWWDYVAVDEKAIVVARKWRHRRVAFGDVERLTVTFQPLYRNERPRPRATLHLADGSRIVAFTYGAELPLDRHREFGDLLTSRGVAADPRFTGFTRDGRAYRPVRAVLAGAWPALFMGIFSFAFLGILPALYVMLSPGG